MTKSPKIQITRLVALLLHILRAIDEMNVMAQDATADQNPGYVLIAKNLCCRGTDKCRQVIVKLIIPQSKKCIILGLKIYEVKLAPHIHKSSSCISDEIVKIHKKQNWFKRCGSTVIDNAAGLGMAMLAGKVVQNQVEVQEFGNLWGLLATRPVVNESTYEILSFTAEFFIALIVFTLTEHFLDEYRQRKKAKETPRISESQQGEVNPQPNMQRVNAASDEMA
jgi:hypothetical protein